MQGTWINDKDSNDRIIIDGEDWTFLTSEKGRKKEKYTFVAEEDVPLDGKPYATTDKVWLFNKDERREFIMISSGPKTLMIQEKGKSMLLYTSTTWLDYMARTDSERKVIQDISDSLLLIFKHQQPDKALEFYPSADALRSNPDHVAAGMWSDTTGEFSDTAYFYGREFMLDRIQIILHFGDSIGFHWDTARLNGRATVHFLKSDTIEYGYTDLWMNDDQSMTVSVTIEMIKLNGRWYITPLIRRSGFNDLKQW